MSITDHPFTQLRFVDPDACRIATGGGMLCGKPKDEHATVADDELPNLLDGTEQFMELACQLGDIGLAEHHNVGERRLRRHMLSEEYTEYCDAEFANDPVEILDGLMDIIVIAWGTALKYFGPEKAKAAAREVVRTNLAKVVGPGLPIFREDGKVLKPQGWTPPDIAGVLGR